jgi:aspartyl-tRNA(Asn)/glutamyl-tRNA(Gln) amidotransferase subunit C
MGAARGLGAHPAASARRDRSVEAEENVADMPAGGACSPVLTRDEVAHLAYLARLQVTDAELDRYAEQLDVILHSVATVAAVANQDIEPTSHAVPLVNVFREDVVRPGLSQSEALAMAPAADAGRFRVPQILGEEQ